MMIINKHEHHLCIIEYGRKHVDDQRKQEYFAVSHIPPSTTARTSQLQAMAYCNEKERQRSHDSVNRSHQKLIKLSGAKR
jgi:hypothetical protein